MGNQVGYLVVPIVIRNSRGKHSVEIVHSITRTNGNIRLSARYTGKANIDSSGIGMALSQQSVLELLNNLLQPMCLFFFITVMTVGVFLEIIFSLGLDFATQYTQILLNQWSFLIVFGALGVLVTFALGSIFSVFFVEVRMRKAVYRLRMECDREVEKRILNNRDVFDVWVPSVNEPEVRSIVATESVPLIKKENYYADQ